MCWMWWSAVLGEMTADRRSGRSSGPGPRAAARRPRAGSARPGFCWPLARASLRLAVARRPRAPPGSRAARARRLTPVGEARWPRPRARTPDGRHARWSARRRSRSPPARTRPRSLGVGRSALVVAGPVALLVVRGRDRVERGQGRRAAQHLLGQHRVKLDAVELRPRERAGLVPDRVRYHGGAEVVHERRPAERGCGIVIASPSTWPASAATRRSGGYARPCTAT